MGSARAAAASTPGRRVFDHLFAEVCVAVGRRLPRYALWLELHDRGLDPEALSPGAAARFCGSRLDGFLADQGLALSRRQRRRLVRTLQSFDPAVATPYECFARLGG